MQSMTELIKVQMQAMTKAASVQSLLPLDRFAGEGSQADDGSVTCIGTIVIGHNSY